MQYGRTLSTHYSQQSQNMSMRKQSINNFLQKTKQVKPYENRTTNQWTDGGSLYLRSPNSVNQTSSVRFRDDVKLREGRRREVESFVEETVFAEILGGCRHIHNFTYIYKRHFWGGRERERPRGVDWPDFGKQGRSQFLAVYTSTASHFSPLFIPQFANYSPQF